MNSTILLAVSGSCLIAGIAIVSAVQYSHKGATYRLGRNRGASIGHFRYSYRLLQVSSIGISLTSLWSDSAWLLKVHSQAWISLCGFVLAILCTWMFVVSKRALGENYSPCFDAYTPFTIISKGPYLKVRHPIYTANIALLFSLFVATGSLWLLFNATVLAAYYLASAVAEERELMATHTEYAQYARRTGRFVPRLRSVPN